MKKWGGIFILILLFISLMGFVAAEDNETNFNPLVGMSNEGVKYDREILVKFFVSDWVHVTVDIRDTTNITIPNKNSPDYELKTQQKKEILIEQTNAVLSTLSDSEFKLKRNSEFGGFFSGNITKEGFKRLLEDNRVRHIYNGKEIQINASTLTKNVFIYLFLPLVIIICGIIVIIKFKKKK
jgi:heterodisulfide reductase subunit A-like polyferredoxin